MAWVLLLPFGPDLDVVFAVGLLRHVEAVSWFISGFVLVPAPREEVDGAARSPFMFICLNNSSKNKTSCKQVDRYEGQVQQACQM